MVTLLLSISFYGNLTIINQFLIVTLLLSISFYGNLAVDLKSFLDTCLQLRYYSN